MLVNFRFTIPSATLLSGTANWSRPRFVLVFQSDGSKDRKITVHLPTVWVTFGSAFSDWLDGGSPIRVAYAQDGERLPQPGEGRVILAPPDGHLIVKEGRLRVTYDAERHSCRPSVDVLFESVAREMGHFAAGCLLTGMGKDGAEGLLALRLAGGITLAQDEETCVVFGMPREAILLGAAEKVLPLQRIAPALRSISEGSPP